MADLRLNFNIPKRKAIDNKERLVGVDLTSRDAIDLLQTVRHSFFNPSFTTSWDVSFITLLHNNRLADKYREKKQEMKADGRNNKELVDKYMFMAQVGGADVISRDGLQTGQAFVGWLGSCESGVYLSRNADIQIEYGTLMLSSPKFQLFVFKAILGKCKPVTPTNVDAANNLEPTPNYDCHISALSAQSAVRFADRFVRTMTYLYEYDDDALPVATPRHCLPIAVITYTRPDNQVPRNLSNMFLRKLPSSQIKSPIKITDRRIAVFDRPNMGPNRTKPPVHGTSYAAWKAGRYVAPQLPLYPQMQYSQMQYPPFDPRLVMDHRMPIDPRITFDNQINPQSDMPYPYYEQEDFDTTDSQESLNAEEIVPEECTLSTPKIAKEKMKDKTDQRRRNALSDESRTFLPPEDSDVMSIVKNYKKDSRSLLGTKKCVEKSKPAFDTTTSADDITNKASQLHIDIAGSRDSLFDKFPSPQLISPTAAFSPGSFDGNESVDSSLSPNDTVQNDKIADAETVDDTANELSTFDLLQSIQSCMQALVQLKDSSNKLDSDAIGNSKGGAREKQKYVKSIEIDHKSRSSEKGGRKKLHDNSDVSHCEGNPKTVYSKIRNLDKGRNKTSDPRIASSTRTLRKNKDAVDGDLTYKLSICEAEKTSSDFDTSMMKEDTLVTRTTSSQKNRDRKGIHEDKLHTNIFDTINGVNDKINMDSNSNKNMTGSVTNESSSRSASPATFGGMYPSINEEKWMKMWENTCLDTDSDRSRSPFPVVQSKSDERLMEIWAKTLLGDDSVIADDLVDVMSVSDGAINAAIDSEMLGSSETCESTQESREFVHWNENVEVDLMDYAVVNDTDLVRDIIIDEIESDVGIAYVSDDDIIHDMILDRVEKTSYNAIIESIEETTNTNEIDKEVEHSVVENDTDDDIIHDMILDGIEKDIDDDRAIEKLTEKPASTNENMTQTKKPFINDDVISNNMIPDIMEGNIANVDAMKKSNDITRSSNDNVIQSERPAIEMRPSSNMIPSGIEENMNNEVVAANDKTHQKITLVEEGAESIPCGMGNDFINTDARANSSHTCITRNEDITQSGNPLLVVKPLNDITHDIDRIECNTAYEDATKKSNDITKSSNDNVIQSEKAVIEIRPSGKMIPGGIEENMNNEVVAANDKTHPKITLFEEDRSVNITAESIPCGMENNIINTDAVAESSHACNDHNDDITQNETTLLDDYNHVDRIENNTDNIDATQYESNESLSSRSSRMCVDNIIGDIYHSSDECLSTSTPEYEVIEIADSDSECELAVADISLMTYNNQQQSMHETVMKPTTNTTQVPETINSHEKPKTMLMKEPLVSKPSLTQLGNCSVILKQLPLLPSPKLSLMDVQVNMKDVPLHMQHKTLLPPPFAMTSDCRSNFALINLPYLPDHSSKVPHTKQGLLDKPPAPLLSQSFSNVKTAVLPSSSGVNLTANEKATPKVPAANGTTVKSSLTTTTTLKVQQLDQTIPKVTFDTEKTLNVPPVVAKTIKPLTSQLTPKVPLRTITTLKLPLTYQATTKLPPSNKKTMPVLPGNNHIPKPVLLANNTTLSVPPTTEMTPKVLLDNQRTPPSSVTPLKVPSTNAENHSIPPTLELSSTVLPDHKTQLRPTFDSLKREQSVSSNVAHPESTHYDPFTISPVTTNMLKDCPSIQLQTQRAHYATSAFRESESFTIQDTNLKTERGATIDSIWPKEEEYITTRKSYYSNALESPIESPPTNNDVESIMPMNTCNTPVEENIETVDDTFRDINSIEEIHRSKFINTEHDIEINNDAEIELNRHRVVMSWHRPAERKVHHIPIKEPNIPETTEIVEPKIIPLVKQEDDVWQQSIENNSTQPMDIDYRVPGNIGVLATAASNGQNISGLNNSQSIARDNTVNQSEQFIDIDERDYNHNADSLAQDIDNRACDIDYRFRNTTDVDYRQHNYNYTYNDSMMPYGRRLDDYNDSMYDRRYVAHENWYSDMSKNYEMYQMRRYIAHLEHERGIGGAPFLTDRDERTNQTHRQSVSIERNQPLIDAHSLTQQALRTVGNGSENSTIIDSDTFTRNSKTIHGETEEYVHINQDQYFDYSDTPFSTTAPSNDICHIEQNSCMSNDTICKSTLQSVSVHDYADKDLRIQRLIDDSSVNNQLSSTHPKTISSLEQCEHCHRRDSGCTCEDEAIQEALRLHFEDENTINLSDDEEELSLDCISENPASIPNPVEKVHTSPLTIAKLILDCKNTSVTELPNVKIVDSDLNENENPLPNSDAEYKLEKSVLKVDYDEIKRALVTINSPSRVPNAEKSPKITKSESDSVYKTDSDMDICTTPVHSPVIEVDAIDTANQWINDMKNVSKPDQQPPTLIEMYKDILSSDCSSLETLKSHLSKIEENKSIHTIKNSDEVITSSTNDDKSHLVITEMAKDVNPNFSSPEQSLTGNLVSEESRLTCIPHETIVNVGNPGKNRGSPITTIISTSCKDSFQHDVHNDKADVEEGEFSDSSHESDKKATPKEADSKAWTDDKTSSHVISSTTDTFNKSSFRPVSEQEKIGCFADILGQPKLPAKKPQDVLDYFQDKLEPRKKNMSPHTELRQESKSPQRADSTVDLEEGYGTRSIEQSPARTLSVTERVCNQSNEHFSKDNIGSDCDISVTVNVSGRNRKIKLHGSNDSAAVSQQYDDTKSSSTSKRKDHKKRHSKRSNEQGTKSKRNHSRSRNSKRRCRSRQKDRSRNVHCQSRSHSHSRSYSSVSPDSSSESDFRSRKTSIAQSRLSPIRRKRSHFSVSPDSSSSRSSSNAPLRKKAQKRFDSIHSKQKISDGSSHEVNSQESINELDAVRKTIINQLCELESAEMTDDGMILDDSDHKSSFSGDKRTKDLTHIKSSVDDGRRNEYQVFSQRKSSVDSDKCKEEAILRESSSVDGERNRGVVSRQFNQDKRTDVTDNRLQEKKSIKPLQRTDVMVDASQGIAQKNPSTSTVPSLPLYKVNDIHTSPRKPVYCNVASQFSVGNTWQYVIDSTSVEPVEIVKGDDRQPTDISHNDAFSQECSHVLQDISKQRRREMTQFTQEMMNKPLHVWATQFCDGSSQLHTELMKVISSRHFNRDEIYITMSAQRKKRLRSIIVSDLDNLYEKYYQRDCPELPKIPNTSSVSDDAVKSQDIESKNINAAITDVQVQLRQTDEDIQKLRTALYSLQRNFMLTDHEWRPTTTQLISDIRRKFQRFIIIFSENSINFNSLEECCYYLTDAIKMVSDGIPNFGRAIKHLSSTCSSIRMALKSIATHALSRNVHDNPQKSANNKPSISVEEINAKRQKLVEQISEWMNQSEQIDIHGRVHEKIPNFLLLKDEIVTNISRGGSALYLMQEIPQEITNRLVTLRSSISHLDTVIAHVASVEMNEYASRHHDYLTSQRDVLIDRREGLLLQYNHGRFTEKRAIQLREELVILNDATEALTTANVRSRERFRDFIRMRMMSLSIHIDVCCSDMTSS